MDRHGYFSMGTNRPQVEIAPRDPSDERHSVSVLWRVSAPRQGERSFASVMGGAGISSEGLSGSVWFAPRLSFVSRAIRSALTMHDRNGSSESVE